MLPCGYGPILFGAIIFAVKWTSHFTLAQSTTVRQGLRADGPTFTLNGQPFVILSGSMHYFRIPKAYWSDRLSSLRAAGLNTVETYVAWNVHEQQTGLFEYSDERDLVTFVTSAQKLGLNVIIRPGPYICAEWEFGGMPAWLLSDPSMQVRTPHSRFLAASERFLNDLLPRLLPYQFSRGGPIIAFQVENEYQTYGADVNYMRRIKRIFDDNGVAELLFTSDGATLLNRMGPDPLPGVLSTVNFQADPEGSLNMLAAFQPGKPLMVTEFWAGWFDHWTDKRHSLDESVFSSIVDVIMKRNASINFYMFHGGTNFGFMNGANGYKTEDDLYISYNPTQTSYDYDAPLSEWGDPAPKFFAIQRLVTANFPQSTIGQVVPKVRRPIGRLFPGQFLTLTDVLNNIILPIGRLATPTYVEYICLFIGGSFCQSPLHGFVAYRYNLRLDDLRSDTQVVISGMLGDRMQIILDGNVIFTVYSDRIQKPFTVRVPITPTSKDLILLVENMGRVNFVHLDQQRKGFSGWAVYESTGTELKSGWMVYDLSMKKDFIQKLTSKVNEPNIWRPMAEANNFNQPAFYRFVFTTTGGEQWTDQFVNFETWDKGVIFINGINLGRYWKTGPQKALYLPAPYIDSGENQILMFELHRPTDWKIDLQAEPALG